MFIAQGLSIHPPIEPIKLTPFCHIFLLHLKYKAPYHPLSHNQSAFYILIQFSSFLLLPKPQIFTCLVSSHCSGLTSITFFSEAFSMPLSKSSVMLYYSIIDFIHSIVTSCNYKLFFFFTCFITSLLTYLLVYHIFPN